MGNDDTNDGAEDILDNLVGGEYDFYGVTDDFDEHLFRLDDVTYAVIQDDEDSILYEVAKAEQGIDGLPLARVVVECDNTIYELVDLHDGHRWLRLGTDYSNAWLPMFVFDFTSKVA